MTDIIPAISEGPFQATARGLVRPDAKVPYGQWEEYGEHLREVQGALRWCIGDWLNYGEAKYGEMYSQALNLWPEYSYSDLSKMKSIANTFMFMRRRIDISWSLHAEIASRPIEEQEQWLDELEMGMTRAELRLSLDGGAPKAKHECPLCGRVHNVG